MDAARQSSTTTLPKRIGRTLGLVSTDAQIGVGKDNEEFKEQMSKSAAGAVYKQAVAAFGLGSASHDEFLRLVKEDPRISCRQALYSAAQSMAELKRFCPQGSSTSGSSSTPKTRAAAKALFNNAIYGV